MKKILLTITALVLLISGGMYANALLKVDTSEPVIKVSSLQKGLVGHWPLDEESYNPATKRFTDKTPNENHGTSANAGSFTTDHKGQSDRAMSFNGTSDYVDCGDDSSLDISDEVTISLWYYPGAYYSKSPSYHLLAGKTPTFSGGYSIGIAYTFPNRLYFTGNSTTIFAYSITDYTKWYHIVGTLKSSTTDLKLYINGNLENSDSDTIGTNAENVKIGGGIIDRYSHGSIADVRIYNRALNTDEIEMLYTTYRPKIVIGDSNKGLVGHWPLDEESLQSATVFADKTPYENTGTKYGSVLKFDGGNDYVDCGSDASIRPSEAISLSAWIKTTNKALSQRIITTENTISIKKGYSLFISANELFFRFGFTSDYVTLITSGVGLVNDTWHHVIVTYDKSNIIIYLDGANVASVGENNSITYTPSIIEIGVMGITTQPLDGSIGDTRIYSRALTPAEVLTMYQGGVVSDTDLEAHYKMGDKSGTTLTDETGTNNGTLTNFADTTVEYGNTHDSGWVTDDTPNVFALDWMGNSDRAMSFDGESDYVDCGNDDSLNLGTGDFSISSWVNTTWSDVNSDKGMFINKYQNANQEIRFGLSYSNSNKGLRILLKDGVNSVNIERGAGSANINDGVWHIVQLTVDRTSDIVKMYLDGVQLGADISIASITGTLTNTGNWKVGTWLGNYFPADIADVRIYDRVLSQTEITSLYEAYRPKITAGSLSKGLVLDMPLTSTYTKDETAGSEVMTDRTPYSNDGQNTGGDVDTDHTSFVSANSDNVRIADSDSLSPTSAMTAVVWVKGVAHDNVVILSHWDFGTAQRSVAIKSNQLLPYNKLQVVISDDGSFDAGHMKRYASSIIVYDSTWHLVGFTFDAGTLKLYVDGAEDTSVTKEYDYAITTIHNSTADITVGSYLNSDTPTNFIDGDLANARIWNRALTDAEILSLYDKGR